MPNEFSSVLLKIISNHSREKYAQTRLLILSLYYDDILLLLSLISVRLVNAVSKSFNQRVLGVLLNDLFTLLMVNIGLYVIEHEVCKH